MIREKNLVFLLFFQLDYSSTIMYYHEQDKFNTIKNISINNSIRYSDLEQITNILIIII